MLQHNNSTNDVNTVNFGELDLPFKASSIMDYHTPATAIVGSTLYVGYLSDDIDCQNPLDDCDGMGKVYSAHRHSSTHAEMQEALGLTSDWDKDLDLVNQHADRFRLAWISAAKQSAEFQIWAEKTAGHGARLDAAYYERRAKKLWRETEGEYIYNEDCIQDFEFTDEVRVELWKTLRSERLIGDKDVVVLDCYQHGGQAWSISGQGMQCRWDTSSGAGVWVPDDCAREEIDRRSDVYAFGGVKDNGFWTRKSGKKRFYGELDGQFGGTVSEQFDDWQEAFEWLSTQSASLKLPSNKTERAALLLIGRMRAASELTRDSLATYNDWLQGSNYGVVIAEFQNVGSPENPQWNFVDEDACWGYTGDDYAMEEAISGVNIRANIATTKAA